MSILTQSGRAAIAASIKEQPIHLAWGSGDSTWESSYKVEIFFTSDGEIKLDHYPVKVTLPRKSRQKVKTFLK